MSAALICDKFKLLSIESVTDLPTFFFFFTFLKIHFVVVDKNISIHSHNYIIHFNDKSGEKLFTLNS